MLRSMSPSTEDEVSMKRVSISETAWKRLEKAVVDLDSPADGTGAAVALELEVKAFVQEMDLVTLRLEAAEKEIAHYTSREEQVSEKLDRAQSQALELEKSLQSASEQQKDREAAAKVVRGWSTTKKIVVSKRKLLRDLADVREDEVENIMCKLSDSRGEFAEAISQLEEEILELDEARSAIIEKWHRQRDAFKQVTDALEAFANERSGKSSKRVGSEDAESEAEMERTEKMEED